MRCVDFFIRSVLLDFVIYLAHTECSLISGVVLQTLVPGPPASNQYSHVLGEKQRCIICHWYESVYSRVNHFEITCYTGYNRDFCFCECKKHWNNCKSTSSLLAQVYTSDFHLSVPLKYSARITIISSGSIFWRAPTTSLLDL